MTFDGKAFGIEIVGVVKGFLEKELAPLSTRIADLEKRIDSLPAPVDLSADLEALKAAIGAIQIPELPQAPELPDIAAMVEEAVDAAVAALPAPEKGVGLAGAFIDRSGELVVTLSNGEAVKLGPVVGKDGEPGADAVGFDDLDVAYDGEKTVTLKFTRGEIVKEFPIVMPVVIDRGVFKDGTEYKAGDAVTWAGSVWIAQKDTGAKPDAGDEWRLSVKRGRDGKDATVKEAKPHQPVRVGVPTKGE
jgi:hypothetical protein